MTQDVGVVIPAAGKGQRLGGPTPKAFVPVAGAPLILHALRVFQASPAVGWVVVAVRAEDRARLQALARAHQLTKLCDVVAGGASRSASVARGVAALPAQAKWVVVHDAARPCLSRRLIESVIVEARRHGAVACGLPAPVTVKAVDGNQCVRLTLDREALWLIQTPQAFRRQWWEEAVAQSGVRDGMPDDPTTCLRPEGPVSRSRGHVPRQSGDGLPSAAPDRWWDDAALLEWAGFPVRIVSGDPLNIKVTTKDDVLLAEAILQARSSRRVRAAAGPALSRRGLR